MFWHQYSQLGPSPSAVSVSECLPLPSKEAGAVSVPSLHSDWISGHPLESMSPVHLSRMARQLKGLRYNMQLASLKN